MHKAYFIPFFTILILNSVSSFYSSLQSSPVNEKTNIIVILADDLGFGDVGYQGCTDFPTDHIDSIAENGVQFSNGYVTCGVCAPTRAGLMTGRYQQRFGFEDNPGPYRRDLKINPGIPKTEITFGEHMKKLGYTTGFIGKQHVGKYPEFSPIKRGFDEFFGFNNGASSYFVNDNPKKMLVRNDIPVENETEYLTDAFGREAVSFIQRHYDKSFFLYLPFNAVHGPLQAPEDLKNKFSQIENAKRRTLAAMAYSMDVNIGKVLHAVKETGIEEKTIIFFLSDNGGKLKGNYSYNTPLHGTKNTFYEGGIRIPFCMQWKGTLPANKKIDSPVISLDILPTAIAAAGGKIDPAWKLDGVNLLPYLLGETEKFPHDILYWRHNRKWAVRMGDWKLCKPANDKDIALYNLNKDMTESKNLLSEFPDKVKELESEFQNWAAGLSKPMWGWQPGINGDFKVSNN